MLPALDRVVSRLTRGRTTLVEQLAGLPVLVVTTTGQRSGRPRPAQLVAIPVGGDLAVIGTDFGQARTPTWVLNLEAERDEILARAGRVYVGYPKYVERVTDRRVRVFALERAVSARR